MRVFTITGGNQGVAESSALPTELPEHGHVWIACDRDEFEAIQAQIQAMLQQLCATQLVDLHMSDLLNNQLPSHYDYTSKYDMLAFRRLSTRNVQIEALTPGKRNPPPAMQRIETSSVGFAVFDNLLLTVHPTGCITRDSYALKLINATRDARANGAKLPTSSADLMLRIVSHMVDGYLELRRELSRKFDHWQAELLKPDTRFSNWSSILDARLAMHQLDEICEDQRAAIQDWIESIETWGDDGDTPQKLRERELLRVRSRDVLEHIERVIHHVQRLEQSTETAVQIHFSAQSHRTNDIMRTLTALTAVFLPLNLITGFFGMNFEFLPIIHSQAGFWLTLGLMFLLVAVVVAVFWRKHYLAQSSL
ncbi:magnesium transporter [Polaromonas sp.]|nr:magnesium transporter [Polaromonas sp.]